MEIKIDIRRALFSFSVSALAPGLISIFMSRGDESDPLAAIFLFVIFYLTCLLIVLPIGFMSLFIAVRVKWGAIIVPLLAGVFVGLFFMEVTYTKGTEISDKIHLLVYGVVTAATAALIYFQPWRKRGL